MALQRSAVRSRLAPPLEMQNYRYYDFVLKWNSRLAQRFLIMKNVALLGQIVFIIGLIMAVVGFVLGFWFMYQGNDEWATKLLFIVPLGFMFLFTGLATSVMFSPRDDSVLNESRSLQDLDDD